MSVLFARLEAHGVRVCEQGVCRRIPAIWALAELLRRNDGSSEGVARTGVLGGGSGQVNVVILYIFVRLGLPGPRKARPARASPPRPRARQSRLSRTTHAYALAKGVNTGRKGVDDGCGEGHMSLLTQTLSAAHIMCHKGLNLR